MFCHTPVTFRGQVRSLTYKVTYEPGNLTHQDETLPNPHNRSISDFPKGHLRSDRPRTSAVDGLIKDENLAREMVRHTNS